MALAAGSAAGHASPPTKSATPAVDLKLLEFLGSVDPASKSERVDDGSWMAYLSQLKPSKSASEVSQTSAAAQKGAHAAAKPVPSGVPNHD